MKNHLTYFSTAAMLAVVLTAPLAINPLHAEAATNTRYYGAFHELDNEDSIQFTRSRVSSATQKKIDKLDDDRVDDLPVPILLGVSPKNLTPNFGDPRDGGTRTHEGEDILAPRGAFVSSPTEAVVIRTGEGESSGIFVTTANPGGETMNFYHLDSIKDGIKAGTELEPGDIIGYVGNTGNAAGGVTHLHFEIRKNRKALDPYPRLTEEFSTQVRIRVLMDLVKELQAELKEKLH